MLGSSVQTVKLMRKIFCCSSSVLPLRCRGSSCYFTGLTAAGLRCAPDDVTDQAQAVGVQWLRFFRFPGRHGDIPSLQLCDHLCWTEEDGRVGTATVDQLHQTLLIVTPAGTDSSSPEQVSRWRTKRAVGGSYWQYPLCSYSAGRPHGSSSVIGPLSRSSNTEHTPGTHTPVRENRTRRGQPGQQEVTSGLTRAAIGRFQPGRRDSVILRVEHDQPGDPHPVSRGSRYVSPGAGGAGGARSSLSGGIGSLWGGGHGDLWIHTGQRRCRPGMDPTEPSETGLTCPTAEPGLTCPRAKGRLQPPQNWWRHWEQVKWRHPPLARLKTNWQLGHSGDRRDFTRASSDGTLRD